MVIHRVVVVRQCYQQQRCSACRSRACDIVPGTSLDITKRDAERIELHFRASGGHITKPDLRVVGLGTLAPTLLRKIVRAIGDQGGVGEWLISHAEKQCVSLPVNLVPILQLQCALDRIASEPEMVVAHRALLEQRLSGCQCGLLIFPLILQQ